MAAGDVFRRVVGRESPYQSGGFRDALYRYGANEASPEQLWGIMGEFRDDLNIPQSVQDSPYPLAMMEQAARLSRATESLQPDSPYSDPMIGLFLRLAGIDNPSGFGSMFADPLPKYIEGRGFTPGHPFYEPTQRILEAVGQSAQGTSQVPMQGASQAPVIDPNVLEAAEWMVSDLKRNNPDRLRALIQIILRDFQGG